MYNEKEVSKKISGIPRDMKKVEWNTRTYNAKQESGSCRPEGILRVVKSLGLKRRRERCS